MSERATIKTIGIIGSGVIGNVLKLWIQNYTKHQLRIYDPAKGYIDNLNGCDVFFIQIHIPTQNNGKQNLNDLEDIIANLPNKPIFIRTTILPGTVDYLRNKLNKDIFFMPEFLTERTAYEDFCSQPMVFTGKERLLKTLFPGKKFIKMSSLDAEIAKYTHNVFGALKVTYFNAVHDFCSDCDANFENVRKGVLLSGYINPTHTVVPGPDGKFGYGGKCFPKDVDALYTATKRKPIGKILKITKRLNKSFRKKMIKDYLWCIIPPIHIFFNDFCWNSCDNHVCLCKLFRNN